MLLAGFAGFAGQWDCFALTTGRQHKTHHNIHTRVVGKRKESNVFIAKREMAGGGEGLSSPWSISSKRLQGQTVLKGDLFRDINPVKSVKTPANTRFVRRKRKREGTKVRKG